MLLIATWTHGTHSSSSAKTCPPADMKHGDYLNGFCHTSWAFKVTATSRDNDPFWGAFSWQIHWRSRRLPLYPGAAAQCCHFDMAAAPRENVLLISFHFNRGLFKLTENWNKDGMDMLDEQAGSCTRSLKGFNDMNNTWTQLFWRNFHPFLKLTSNSI